MARSLPNGSTFDIAATYSEAKTVSVISNANPAIASSTAHGLLEGDYVIITSTWGRLNNRVFRVGEVTADTFELLGADTTDLVVYTAGGSGSFRKILTWTQITQILGVDFSGGDQNFYQFQFLESDDEYQVPTNKTAVSMTLTVADDPDQDYTALVEKYDESKGVHALKLNLVNGSTILYPAIVTITGTPTLAVNELMTRSISLAMQARHTRYSGV